jgi:membrane protein YqaA with SNARE-associated domain
VAVKLVAALWGLAEATLFFIVPDVWVSLVASRRGLRAALIACLFAAAGALVGGVVMYGWGHLDPTTAVAALDRVPAVSPSMIDRVESQLAGEGVVALLLGAFTGIPYKVYAVLAAVLGIPLIELLLVTVPARLARFVLVALIVSALSTTAFKSWKPTGKMWITIGFWLLFYATFLWFMPN